MVCEVKNKYGLNVHGCIVDELLGQTDRKLYDAMTLGSGSARRQSLNFVITTAGNDKLSVCYEEHTYAMDILHGRKIDPSYYPVVFAARDDDDWEDPEVWKRVNPSYGITVPEDFYQDIYTKAKYSVDKEMEFRQFYLNQVRAYARKNDLKPSFTYYKQWGRKGKKPTIKLRFSKYGDEGVEKGYATHYVSAKRMAELKQTQADNSAANGNGNDSATLISM